jgi:hypothetical protein
MYYSVVRMILVKLEPLLICFSRGEALQPLLLLISQEIKSMETRRASFGRPTYFYYMVTRSATEGDLY